MKKLLITLALFMFSGTAKLEAQVSFGVPELINDGWKFLLSDVEGAQAPQFDDSGWQHTDLPHDWSVRGQLSPTLASCTGYLPGGTGWYRKTLEIPSSAGREKTYIYFEGVYNYSDVYVNGHHAGHRPNGYVSFMYDITPYVEYGAENTIAVRVDHSRYADSRWYTGSGIYRNVWLVSSGEIHIAQWGVFAYPKFADVKKAELAVSVEVENGSAKAAYLTVTNELVSPDGKVAARASGKLTVAAGSAATVPAALKVSNPELWNLDNPRLYTLRTTVSDGKTLIDCAETKTGIRTFTFDPDKGFALNGTWMKMKGVCIHHDGGVLGSAVPREVWKRRLLNLKSIGCNAIRTSHNPQSPDLYELCDELGFLVIDEGFDEWEFPKRKWLQGWNRGTPGFDGAYAYFEEWGEQDMADIVRRDRNHASIFAWSIGNEVDYPNDPYSHPILGGRQAGGFTQPTFGGYKKDAPDAMRLGGIAKRMRDVVKKYDTSRPVTAGLAGVAMSNETAYPSTLDIAGYNYTESRYGSDHEKYPQRVIYGSENRHDLDAWQSVVNNPHIFGQFLWTGIDYLGESGPWPSRGFYSGLLDFGGFVKPRGYYRKSLWTSEPMVYLGTYPSPLAGMGSNANADVWSALEGAEIGEKSPSMDAWPVWNYAQGDIIRVVCYSNTASSRLLLNGREIGAGKDYDTRTGITFWDVPYHGGELKAEGFDASGNKVAEYSVHTSRRPHRIVATADAATVSKDRGLVSITLNIIDEDGRPVLVSDDEITCNISGPARLLGLEGSNNSDMGDYTDNVQRVYKGRMIAYIQASGEGGIAVEFTAPWLEAARVTIDAR